MIANVNAAPPSDSIAHFHSSQRPDNVLQSLRLNQLRFTADTEHRVNFGLTGRDFKYFVIKVPASVIEDRRLSIDNTSLDSVLIYNLQTSSHTQVYAGGAAMTFERSKNYVWHVADIQPEGGTFLVAVKADGKNINVAYRILSRDQLNRLYRDHDRMILFYSGVFSLILAIVLAAWYVFRRNRFPWYGAYVICLSAWIFSHYGYLFPLVYPNVPVLNEIVKPISSLGACFCMVVLLSILFRQPLDTQPWLDRMLMVLKKTLLCMMLAMILLIIPNLAPVLKSGLFFLWHAGLLFSICLTIFTPFYFYNYAPVGRVLSLAMFIVGMMAVLQLLGNSGYVNNYFLNEHGVTLGCIVENFIIAFGLFYGLLEERKQHQRQLLALETQQTETLKKLISLQESERKRIAADLHDNIGPLLSALKINFRRLVNTDPAQRDSLVEKTEDIIDDSISEIRNVAHNLMPKGLSTKGLISTLRDYFEELGNLYGKAINFSHSIQSIVDPELQLHIYRIICELVLNAARHSTATRIAVSIKSNSQLISADVEDNGEGFTGIEPRKSFGLEGVRSRVEYLGGRVQINSPAGEGVAIHFEIPLQSHEAKVQSF